MNFSLVGSRQNQGGLLGGGGGQGAAHGTASHLEEPLLQERTARWTFKGGGGGAR